MNNSLEDVFLWPDDTWCYREEYYNNEMLHMGDDFTVLYFATEEYNRFFERYFEYD